MMQLYQYQPQYFDEVVNLISRRYEIFHIKFPLLPDRYEEKDVITPLFHSLIDNAPGVVAYDDGRLVGFLGGWLLPSFRGCPAALSPEWANVILEDYNPLICEEMYAYLAKEWLLAGYYTHLICQYADRKDLIKIWHWQGFGMMAADAVRSLDPLGLSAGSMEIKRACIHDAEDVLMLGRALGRHMTDSPTFLYNEDPDSKESVLALLTDPDQVVWLCYQHQNAIGFLRHGPASDEASTLIVDPGTTSIRGLYTLPSERSRGVASNLLNHALMWSRDQGYKRCCVDFEPMNYLAARFWIKYFHPISFAMVRHIDTRISFEPE